MATDPRVQSSSLLLFNEPAVTLVVGPDQHKFLAHQSDLQQASPFFTAAFKEQWQQGKSGGVTLPDEEPAMVNMYLHFIYTGKIASKTPESSASAEYEPHRAEYETLARLYCFGEKYQDIRLKNATIEAMIEKAKVPNSRGARYYPVGTQVDLIYKGTCANSPARKLMVDMHVKAGQANWLDVGVNNPDFVADLSRQLLARFAKPAWDLQHSVYHEADERQPKGDADSRKKKLEGT